MLSNAMCAGIAQTAKERPHIAFLVMSFCHADNKLKFVILRIGYFDFFWARYWTILDCLFIYFHFSYVSQSLETPGRPLVIRNS